MRHVLALLAAALLLSGCSGTDQPDSKTKQQPDAKPADSSTTASDSSTTASGPPTTSSDPGATQLVTMLTPANTNIEFVCAHTDPNNPEPRTGHFEDFQGRLVVDSATKKPVELSVEIKTDSLTTSIDKLTNHLKSPDFFDTKEYPTATFTSQSIDAGDGENQFTISGQLTMMKTTKELSFPAQVTASDSGVELNAEFEFDRTAWGMDGFQDRVEKMVTLKVSVSGQ